MKKSLLFVTIAILLSIGLNAQEWNFGNDSVNFPIYAGVPAGTTVTIQGLSITAGTTPANMGQVEASVKTYQTTTYHHRFKFNGGGYTGASATDLVPLVNMPTQRYISFAVAGNSTIKVHGITGSSTSARKLFVTTGATYIGAMDMPTGSEITEATLNYTGPATTLYVFCNASINLYLLKVSPITSVKVIPSDIGISFNGTQILNTKGMKLEVYNASGMLITRSCSSIPTGNFPKGVYIVRVAGSNTVLKFSK